MEIDPKPILGNWAHGWALDRHTLCSRAAPGGDPSCPRFASERSEVGEALFRLKYQDERSQVAPIAAVAAAFVRARSELADLDAILPVPPSDTRRSFQPVPALAAALGLELGLPAPDDFLLKTRATRPLKDLGDKRRRREELVGAFAVADRRFAGRHLLLFDDLFRSGETLKAVTACLLFEGGAGVVSVLALTATRTRR
ncbi:MAG: ComF family protein [Candidatus Aminicenantes bacterium]|nr:ComF family protein [Candidatus Aminicenantes bacterium]